MLLNMRSAWAQILGTRERQEDSASVTRWENGYHLLILADGMGGHHGGQEASRIVTTRMRESFLQASQSDAVVRSVLRGSLEATNRALSDYLDLHPELDGMGSTLVGAVFDGECLDWVSVGDSPLFLIRGGEIRRLNSNHSMAAVLAAQVAAGEISAEHAKASPRRSELLAAVMGGRIALVDAPETPVALRPGDAIVLASDGLEVLSPAMITEIVTEHFPIGPQAVVDGLLESVSALGRRHQDNTTVIAGCVGENNPPATPSLMGRSPC